MQIDKYANAIAKPACYTVEHWNQNQFVGSISHMATYWISIVAQFAVCHIDIASKVPRKMLLV